MNGIITKLMKGYGFIRGEDDVEYFFAAVALDSIDTGVHFEELARGQDVEFEDTVSSKGPRAEQVRLV